MSRRSCLSPEALALLIDGGGSNEDERHASRCSSCSRAVDLLRRVQCAGVDVLDDTLSEVDKLLATLLHTRRADWWKVVRRDEFRRADVARRLWNLSIDARSHDASLAVHYAQCSTAVLDLLSPDEQEVLDLRFEAWKLLAVVLREDGRFSEATAALDHASAAAAFSSRPELADASILLARAFLCIEPDIWEPAEGARLIDLAEQILAERDAGRLPTVHTARAFLLFRSGDMKGARELFASVLASTPESDHQNYLNALSNLTFTRLELREDDQEVERSIDLLIAKNVELGRTAWAARARWMNGKLHMLRGAYSAATEMLTSAMQTIGDSDTSVRVGLDLIQTLLLDDRHREAYDLACELATRTVALDQRERSRRHKLTAEVCAYIREAAERQAWTADLVFDVACYIDKIGRQRPFDFVPPLPLATM